MWTRRGGPDLDLLCRSGRLISRIFNENVVVVKVVFGSLGHSVLVEDRIAVPCHPVHTGEPDVTTASLFQLPAHLHF